MLREVEILRDKQSDRVEGIQQLVAAAGGTTRLLGADLEVTPPTQPSAELQFHSRGDHRLAMAAATLSVLTQTPLELEDPDCVEKSVPGFWDQLRAAGARLSA